MITLPSSLVAVFLSRQLNVQRSPQLHFSRLFIGDNLATSLFRHQHYLCSQLRPRCGDTVLVIGCGNGDAAFKLVHYADVNVVAVGFDPAKVSCRIAVCASWDDRCIYMLF